MHMGKVTTPTSGKIDSIANVIGAKIDPTTGQVYAANQQQPSQSTGDTPFQIPEGVTIDYAPQIPQWVIVAALGAMALLFMSSRR